jgi:hypothetical protein
MEVQVRTFNATRDRGQAIYPLSLGGVGQACYSVQYKPRSLPLLKGAGAMGTYGIHYFTYEEIYIQRSMIPQKAASSRFL